MKNINKKWFILQIALIFSIVIWVFTTVIYKSYLNADFFLENTYKQITANNYATEWLEKVMAYYKTKVNFNKTNWWNNFISPLSWNYTITISNSDYLIQSNNFEEIYESKPYNNIYKRYISIENGNDLNEKIIISKVYYSQHDYIEVRNNIYNINSN